MNINNKIFRLFFAAAFILFLFACWQAQTKKAKQQRRSNLINQEAKAIAYAKKYLVSNIDPKLPHLGFEEWFQKTVGETAQVDWEVNDCGEQSGTSADRGRDFPMCVEAKTQKAQFIYISVSIQFGSFRRGISREKPAVRSITFGEEMGGEWLENLSDLPKKIEANPISLKYFDPNGG